MAQVQPSFCPYVGIHSLINRRRDNGAFAASIAFPSLAIVDSPDVKDAMLHLLVGHNSPKIKEPELGDENEKTPPSSGSRCMFREYLLPLRQQFFSRLML